MSIEGEIQHRTTEGRLTVFRPMMPNTASRALYLSSEVIQLATNPPNKDAEKTLGAVQALFESFVNGDELVVRMPPSKNVETVLALLEPRHEEVWEFRIRYPKPAVRVFGRFAMKDTFVATSWSYRSELDISSILKNTISKKEIDYLVEKKWRDLGIQRSKSDWQALFPNYSPLHGEHLHEYLSNARLVP